MLIDLIDQYLQFSMDTKAIGTYRGEVGLAHSLKRCFEWIDVCKVEDLDYESHQEIVRYYKLQTRCKNSSINKHVFYLKAILRHFGYKVHPFLLVRGLPDDTAHFKVIKQEDLNTIMIYVANKNTSANSLFYRGAVFLLYETGCRIGELLNIKIKNIDMINRMILLEKTKSHKERLVPYSKLGELVLEDMIRTNKQAMYLFWNQLKNRRMEYNDIKNYYRRLRDVTGIEKLHSHQFRKTMATNLVKKGARTKTVQNILGHQTESQTEIYVDYNSIVAKEDYDIHSISTGIISAIENKRGGLSTVQLLKKRS
jgi:integrase